MQSFFFIFFYMFFIVICAHITVEKNTEAVSE